MRSSVGDVFVLSDTVRLLRIETGGIWLAAGEIVIAIGEAHCDDPDEVFFFTRFGIGTLPDDDTFYNIESKKL